MDSRALKYIFSKKNKHRCTKCNSHPDNENVFWMHKIYPKWIQYILKISDKGSWNIPVWTVTLIYSANRLGSTKNIATALRLSLKYEIFSLYMQVLKPYQSTNEHT